MEKCVVARHSNSLRRTIGISILGVQSIVSETTEIFGGKVWLAKDHDRLLALFTRE